MRVIIFLYYLPCILYLGYTISPIKLVFDNGAFQNKVEDLTNLVLVMYVIFIPLVLYIYRESTYSIFQKVFLFTTTILLSSASYFILCLFSFCNECIEDNLYRSKSNPYLYISTTNEDCGIFDGPILNEKKYSNFKIINGLNILVKIEQTKIDTTQYLKL